MPPTLSPDLMPVLSCTGLPECASIAGSVCGTDSTCVCPDDLPVYVKEVSKCLAKSSLNTTCQYDAQCQYMEEEYGRCGSNNICTCIKGYVVKMHPNVGINCVKNSGSASPVDPAMIGVLVGLAVMFVIICVVLRLFAKARFRETRSIFNTPNPRLMNASLFKDSKLLSPARGERRGSRISVRAPSRTASLASVNAPQQGRSPNGSLANKGRRGSVASTASGHIGTGAGRAGSPGPETPKGTSSSPAKDKHRGSNVAIETVD